MSSGAHSRFRFVGPRYANYYATSAGLDWQLLWRMTHDTMLDHAYLVANDRHIRLQPPMEQLEQHEDSGRQTIMKAVVCKAYGPPESLAVEEIESLMPGRNQVVVSV